MIDPVFILSTGRTGTQFFENYINHTANNAICKHEPKPSRRFKFLSNLYLNNKVSDNTIINIYNFSRKKLFKEIDDKIYIESSNFLFGCIPALNKYFPNIKIIHIVRHPVTYIESHLNHGFWKGHKKFFAKYIPYWLEDINAEYINDPIFILGARWKYVNELIESYKKTNKYLMIRFEDFFSRNPEISSEELNKIREFIGVPVLDTHENIRWVYNPKNKSKRKNTINEDKKNLILDIYHKECYKYNYIS